MVTVDVANVFADTDIILEIHSLQYGRPFRDADVSTKRAFERSLNAFSKGLRQGVTLGTIQNWLKSEPRAPNNNGKRFLLSYVRHLIADNLLKRDMQARAAVLEVFLNETVSERRLAERRGMPSERVGEDGIIDEIVVDRLGNLFRASRRNGRSITNDLFHNGNPDDSADWSYFLVYRYSTNRGEILKSFLVVQKPDPKFMDYGFNHFVWGGEKKGQNPNVFRECEGAVLALEKAYYFMGYNFLVGGNKRALSAEHYEKLRTSSKTHPNGMGLLSAEYEEISRDKGLFSGVTMTIAAGHQPVVARIAFLHLGTKTTLGHQLSDRHVDLRELSAGELISDLKKTVRRLKIEYKCERFGIHLQEAIEGRGWEKVGATRLAERILRMIDNTPDWEIAQSNLSRKAAKNRPSHINRRHFSARGALETFGSGRPRE